MGKNPVYDLFVVTAKSDWYADIVKFLTTQKLPENWTKDKRRTIKINSIHFTMVEHRLLRRGADGLLRKYVSEIEVSSILEVCHKNACGGYFSSLLTDQKIIRTGYFWPSLFKDSHDYAKRCDVCQMYLRNGLWMEMSLHVLLPRVSFRIE